MAGQAPNSTNIGRVNSGVANATNVVVHPEYQYWRSDWQKLRDVLAGQREIKRQGQRYLRKLPKMDAEDYESYLDAALFYNMTGQTLSSMIGQVFRRDPLFPNLPKKWRDKIRTKFAKDGTGIVNVIKGTITEQIGMGRYGILVDAPASLSLTPTSFAVAYAAENILDWTIEEVNGSYEPTRVLLREFKREQYKGATQDNPWIGAKPHVGKPHAPGVPQRKAKASVRDPQPIRNTADEAPSLVRASNYVQAYTYSTVYRELCLEPQADGSWVYAQYTYDEDPNGIPSARIEPTVRGATLDFIPFQFFGASGNTADVEKSPLLDIADLNLSHYRTYGQLEHGRAFTALPVYYAPGKDNEGASEYAIGPSVVWEVPSGEAVPGILEYKGTGLKALESALDTKQSQIAAIGGRLMPGAAKKGSESPDETSSRESSEQALLLNCIQACEFGMTWVIRWWLMWRDVPLSQTEDLDCEINRSFSGGGIDARELRAITLLYDSGHVPIDVLFNALISSEYLDPETTVEEFKAMLADPRSFPNNPDIAARQRGFDSRQQELDQTSVAREADMQQQEIDLQEREVELMEEAPPAPIVAPKAPAPTGAVPPRVGGPIPPKPGKGGQTSKAKKPTPGGQAGGSGN